MRNKDCLFICNTCTPKPLLILVRRYGDGLVGGANLAMVKSLLYISRYSRRHHDEAFRLDQASNERI